MGQIIKVKVLERTGASQYLISYKNIRLNAYSEVDLLSKSVWLKVTQKTPMPKLQLIIEEIDNNLDELFTYINENNPALHAVHKKEITYKDLLTIYKGIIVPYLEKDNIAKLINSSADTPVFQENIINALTPLVNSLDKVNLALIKSLDKDADISICILLFTHKFQFFTIPFERIANTISGNINTKHFGKICLKINKKDNITKIFFENNIFKNALNHDIETVGLNCLKIEDILAEKIRIIIDRDDAIDN